MATCFAAITLLLICWVLTLVALYVVYRKNRERLLREPGPSGDLFLSLASQKAKEAKELVNALDQLHRLLGIRVFKHEGGRIEPVSQRALDMPEGLRGAIEQELQKAGGAAETTISIGDSVFLIRKVEAGNTWLVIVEDVTKSFSMAKKIKENERLAMLGKMGANMAHQLKTPLAVLAGRVQMLRRRLAGNPEACTLCTEIFEETRELAEQIAQVVELYRLHHLAIERLPLHPILEETRKKLARIDPAIRLEVSCPPGLELETDPRIVGNIVFLVAQNALKPNAAATSVTITAAETGEEVKIYIEDDGVGIPEQERDHLFEPFKGGSEEGLGLGLFLAKDLAARLGGDVVFEPVRKGAKFTVRLPKRPPQGPA